MSTEPFRAFLDRDLSKALGREIIDIASPLLKELVNHATNVLVRCDQSSNGGIDEDLAPFTLYHHIIEQTDGIEVLITESCTAPAIPLLRSSFEALLYLEYIFEDDREYVQRSLSWLLGHIHERLNFYDRLDPSTPKGMEFKKNFDVDIIAKNMELPSIDDVRARKSALEEMLSKPHIQPIEAEYQKFKNMPHWYQLFGGPNDLRTLAICIKRGAEYDLLYRHWSKFTHAQDLISFVQKSGKVKMLRDPNEIKEITTSALSFILCSTQLMIGKYRGGENIQVWYEREIIPLFQQLCKIS
ncbi:MAG: DUF5677 domain-containing protein [bacterium]